MMTGKHRNMQSHNSVFISAPPLLLAKWLQSTHLPSSAKQKWNSALLSDNPVFPSYCRNPEAKVDMKPSTKSYSGYLIQCGNCGVLHSHAPLVIAANHISREREIGVVSKV